MNLGSIVNMIMRMITRRGIGMAMNKGSKRASGGKGAKPPATAGQTQAGQAQAGRAQSTQARATAKRARQAAAITRRLGR